MENKVLTETEVANVKELRSQFFNLSNVAGSIEVQMMNLELEKENIKAELKNLNNKEQVLAKELEEKYGKGTISLESSEFIPAPQTLEKV